MPVRPIDAARADWILSLCVVRDHADECADELLPTIQDVCERPGDFDGDRVCEDCCCPQPLAPLRAARRGNCYWCGSRLPDPRDLRPELSMPDGEIAPDQARTVRAEMSPLACELFGLAAALGRIGR